MFDSKPPPGRPEAKVQTTIGALPERIDLNQPPNKKYPWRAIFGSGVGFVRNVEILMSDELYRGLESRGICWGLGDNYGRPEPKGMEMGKAGYMRIVMKLENWLEKEIFDKFIKDGKS